MNRGVAGYHLVLGLQEWGGLGDGSAGGGVNTRGHLGSRALRWRYLTGENEIGGNKHSSPKFYS